MRIRVNGIGGRGSREREMERERSREGDDNKNQQNVTNNKLLCVQLESLFCRNFCEYTIDCFRRANTYGKRTKARIVCVSLRHIQRKFSNQINNHVE